MTRRHEWHLRLVLALPLANVINLMLLIVASPMMTIELSFMILIQATD
jgi:hypothetical protein